MKIISGALASMLAFIALPCAAETGPSHSALHLSRANALARAKAAALKNGYDPSKFYVDNFISHLSDDGKTWLFLFRCLPNPAPPDCGFSADVARDTGEVKVHRLL